MPNIRNINMGLFIINKFLYSFLIYFQYFFRISYLEEYITLHFTSKKTIKALFHYSGHISWWIYLCRQVGV